MKLNSLLIIAVIVCVKLLSIVKSDFINDEVMGCINIGEKCSGYLIGCIGGSCQYPNVTGEISYKVCLEYKKINESCFEDSDCEVGLTCIKRDLNSELINDHICKDIKFASLGEPCDENIDCIGSLKCVNSICTNYSQTCIEIHDCQSEYYCNGGNCDWVNLQQSDSEIPVENNCSDSRCVPTLDKGAYCIYESDCKLGLICAQNSCVEKYSSQIGERCSGNQCDISKSLICQDGLCAKRNESTTTNCLKDKCQFSDEICDSNSGKCVHYQLVFSEKCKIAERNRNLCYIKNKCAIVNGNDVNLSKRSCTMKHCSNETNEYVSQCYSFYLKNNSCQ